MTWASLIGPSVERRLEGAEVEPVGLQRHRHQLDPEPLQHQQRAVVGRLLDDDPVAWLEQVLEQHPAGLQRAVGDHHLRRRRARRAARRSTRRAPDARSRSRRRAPFPSPRRAPRPPHRAPRRSAGCRRWAPRGRRKSCRRPSRLDTSNARASPPPARPGPDGSIPGANLATCLSFDTPYGGLKLRHVGGNGQLGATGDTATRRGRAAISCLRSDSETGAIERRLEPGGFTASIAGVYAVGQPSPGSKRTWHGCRARMR